MYEYIRRDEEGNVEGITTAVDDVDLDIEQGDFVAVLGAQWFWQIDAGKASECYPVSLGGNGVG